MEPLKDASHLYEVERRVSHAERPGFRINELQISPTQKVPWHYHREKSESSCANQKKKFDLVRGIHILLRLDART